MGLIELNGLEVYAFHGVHDIEQTVGQWYEVNLSLTVDFKKAEQNDELSGTVDYSIINDLVLAEMKIKSKLIEHVAGRIKRKIQSQFPLIKSGTISISKLNPPVKGMLDEVVVTASF
ncbi:MAG: dihydroneopterin aldolase [Glaciecola sp.]|jgi:dihydroneopterin aldolase